jgi:TMEM175 potassium channel family protein
LLTQRLTPGLGAYLALIITGLFFPVAAVIGYLAIAIYFIVPSRVLTTAIHRSRHRSAQS